MILGNTYHLYLRPGVEVIEKLGGLSKFMGWNGPILTDSGGYQIFSLSSLRKITDEGVIFRSHIDGKEHFFSPENVIEYQEKLGVDIIMPLDECVANDQDVSKISSAMSRTHKWAERSKKQHKRQDQKLFAIVQGGVTPELRKESADYLTSLDFPGYAIGGLSLGESKETTWSIVEATLECLPANRPRYLMGVGSPEDLVEGISLGIDIFDCALPTRVARNGALFTSEGRQNIYKAKFVEMDEPIDINCDCYTCRNFSAAYLHHLFKSGELLALRLATIHNLRFIIRLIDYIRRSIDSGKFDVFRKEFLDRYKATDEEARIYQKKKWLTTNRSQSIDGTQPS
jgi:queuine tRNA-ribosyltransferase